MRKVLTDEDMYLQAKESYELASSRWDKELDEYKKDSTNKNYMISAANTLIQSSKKLFEIEERRFRQELAKNDKTKRNILRDGWDGE